MKFKTLLRAFPVMLMVAILGVGVVAAPVGAAVGTWTFSALTGAPGTTITVTGTGFTAGNTFTIDWQGIPTPIGSGTVASNGTISTSFVVPAVPRGNYSVSYTHDTGAIVDTATAKTFTVAPGITLPVTTAPVGTVITVSGFGFDPIVAIQILFSTETTAIQNATTGANGSFSAQFIVPQNSRLSYTITARQTLTPSIAATALFAITPRITSISASAGGVGDPIVINGDGFTAFGSVSVFFDSESTTPLTSVTANSTGIIPATTITIPASFRGTHTIFVRDNTATAISTSQSFNLNQTKISLSATSGQVGTSITINGNGFPASTSISFEFDGAAFTGVTAINSGTNGSFSKTGVIIPTTASGQHTIAARYGSDAGAIAEATFTVTAKITMTPTTGTAGTSVMVTGSGFAPTATVTLAYDSLPLSTAPASILTLANGTFTAQFTAPGAAAGAHTIVAADGQGIVASAVFTSTITAEISPVTSTATPGNVGQDITVTGTGFMPGGTVTVKFDNANVATATANATGGFTATFKVPAVAKGDHPITAADSLTTRTFTFVMEGNAPAAPALSSPAAETKPKQPITFEWNAVTDPSAPVTYKLEVATDANFSTLILSKENLTVTSYTTTATEKLPTVSKKAPYYWRVIATDSAGNVSTPAAARTFVVGFSLADVPVWAWVIIGVLLVAIIGGLIYYFSIRRRPPPPTAEF